MAEPITREEVLEWLDGIFGEQGAGNPWPEMDRQKYQALRLLLTDYQEWPYCDLCTKVIEAQGKRLVERRDARDKGESDV